MQYTASLQVRPTAMMDEGASQPCAFIASLIQNPRTVMEVHVRRSMGVTSASMLDHLSGSANVVFCFGMTHPEGFVFSFKLAFVGSNRWRIAVDIVSTAQGTEMRKGRSSSFVLIHYHCRLVSVQRCYHCDLRLSGTPYLECLVNIVLISSYRDVTPADGQARVCSATKRPPIRIAG